jgi:hypothetical protein
MNVKVVYTPHTKFESIVKDLESKLDIGFEPSFFFLFLTESVYEEYPKIIEYLKKRFPNTKMAGCFVEGYTTEGLVWMRGLAILFIEAKGVDVFWAKGRNTTETFKRLREKVGGGWDSILLIFPVFYFPSRFDFLKFPINDRIYYLFKYKKAKTLEDKIRVLKEYSRLLESRYLFPVNKALRIMADETPIIGLNLMPLEAKFGTPIIFADYKNIGRGAVAVCFKGNVNTIFHDVFPERGKSFEETVEILKNYFPNVEVVDVIKRGIAIGEINGVKPVEFLESKVRSYKMINQNEALSKLEKGNLLMVSPYSLTFISKETFGGYTLGLLPVPINLYPSLIDLNNFYDKSVLLGETFKGGLSRFGEIFKKRRYADSFVFFIMDSNTIMMFGGCVHKIIKTVKDYCSNYLGVFSGCPSVYLKNLDRNYFTEIEKNVCSCGTGTNVMLEIRDLK